MSFPPLSDLTDFRRSKPTVSIAALIVTTLLSVACRGDVVPGASEADPTSPSTAEQWTLSEVPVLEIGVVEGDPAYQLHEAVSSVRLPDGEVAVINAGSQEVRFYSPEGRHLRSTGGNGSGPTEFRRPARIWRWGADSLRVLDGRLSRFTFMDLEGAVARTERLEPYLQFMSKGSPVNLERSLKAGDPIGGHFVTGHIDGLGEIVRWDQVGQDHRMDIAAPAPLMRYLVPKGSVALDGISLTVAEVKKRTFHEAMDMESQAQCFLQTNSGRGA